jgi:hypothetical protein
MSIFNMIVTNNFTSSQIVAKLARPKSMQLAFTVYGKSFLSG